MFRQVEVHIPYSLINFTILMKLRDNQLLLLYLKFESNTINFESFSSRYRITYDSYQHILKSLKRQQIVKEVNKNNSSKFKTYKLIKQNVRIFSHATKSDEELVYRYLHSSTATTTSRESNSYIQIILNRNALKFLKQIKKKYKSKPFKKSSIIGNNPTTTKQRAFKFLIDHNAICKIDSQYVLAEFSNQAIKQAKQKKNPPILNSADLNSIIKDTKWEKYCNIHNLEISTTFEDLYNDSLYSDELNLEKYNILSSNNNNQEGRNIIKRRTIQEAQVTVRVYPDDKTMITIKCSENPIYQNKLLRLDKILAEIIEILNKDPYVTKKYDHNSHNFTVVKHDKARDGKLPYRVKKGLHLKYENTDNHFFYIKANYKYSNFSWIRSEIRADNTKYNVYDFRKMLLNSTLNKHAII